MFVHFLCTHGILKRPMFIQDSHQQRKSDATFTHSMPNKAKNSST
jgi:hypothetical protein